MLSTSISHDQRHRLISRITDTVDTFPMSEAYYQSHEADSAPSTPSESSVRSFHQADVEEPLIRPSSPTEPHSQEVYHDYEAHDEVKPQPSPLATDADYDPFNPESYPKTIKSTVTPQTSMTNLRILRLENPSRPSSPDKNSPRSVKSLNYPSKRLSYGHESGSTRPETPSKSIRYPVRPSSAQQSPNPRQSTGSPTSFTRSAHNREQSEDFAPSNRSSFSLDKPLPRRPTLSNRLSIDRVPAGASSASSSSLFQKTRSLFEASSANSSSAAATSPGNRPRPLSGSFSRVPSESPRKRKSSISSIRSTASVSRLRTDSVTYQDQEEDLLVPRSLDPLGGPPSPAYRLPTIASGAKGLESSMYNPRRASRPEGDLAAVSGRLDNTAQDVDLQ